MTIGVFDSGIGGLTVLRAIRDQLPDVSLIYLADFGYAPYGPRTAADIIQRSRRIIQWMHRQGVSLVVAACHTSSAVLDVSLLMKMPCAVVTMLEPTVSCIVQQAQQEVWEKGVGVLGTALTIQKGTLAHALRDAGFGLNVVGVACPGLAETIEAFHWEEAYDYMQRQVFPVFEHQAVDMLVYGCTHYPFIHSWVARQDCSYLGRLMDPAHEVGRIVARTYAAQDQALGPFDALPPKENVRFFYTGVPEQGHVRLAHHWPMTHSTHTSLDEGGVLSVP